MLATFLIEILGALWIFLRYKQDNSSRLIIALLVGLGAFQLAEYMVCEGAFGISSLDWARFGYVAITLLPPLGIHLGLTIAKRKNTGLLLAAYGSSAVFAIFFLLVGHGITGQVCRGNYIIFEIAPYAIDAYMIYYYGWLILSSVLMSRWRRSLHDKNQREALAWLAVGYAAFILPTTFVNIAYPETIGGIPSIMCGFAVILAFILILRVAPLVLEERGTPQSSTKNTPK